jgi:hypothetical protein
LLTLALEQIPIAFDGEEISEFHDAWLRTVLAGLGDPERNPYYGGPGHEEIATGVPRGLFARILEHESTIVAKTTARPRWTEASVGRQPDDGTVLQDGCATIETPMLLLMCMGTSIASISSRTRRRPSLSFVITRQAMCLEKRIHC